MANEDIDREVEQLKSDIADLREDMASLVKVLKDAGLEQGKRVYERTYERARGAGDAARERADRAYESFGREVEERPLASVLTAFGTGFVVGMLLDGRHHR
jgi:ElaB/YqjD/DUF883 family membrane-anchored ribosome-binding protein